MMKMKEAKYRNVEAGIEHLSSHVQGALDRNEVGEALHYITTNTGNPSACAASLAAMAMARGMLAWFKEGNLESLKQHMYESAQLERIAYLLRPSRSFCELVCLAPLLSDNKAILNWYQTAEEIQPRIDADNPKAHGFRWMQMVYALRGDWKMLGPRAERVVELAPSSQKKFMVDHRFYLALARGDVGAMDAALNELTSEKMARVRNDELPFGYTHFFIGTHAVIYAKLAWLHGFEVRVDSPYVPAEWLPVKSLAHYSDPYEFMKGFELAFVSRFS
jgi:hypothetical protein